MGRRRSREPIFISAGIIAKSVNSKSMLLDAYFGMSAHGCGSYIRKDSIPKAYPDLDEEDLRLMPYTRSKGDIPFLPNNRVQDSLSFLSV